MANQNIPRHYITEFSENFYVKLQQEVSRLMPYVKIVPCKGEQKAIDGYGSLEMRDVTGRFQPVQAVDLERERRALKGLQREVSYMVDRKDTLQMLQDPNSPVIQRMVAAAMRKIDQVIYQAAFASVYTGKNLDTLVTAAADGVITVDATGGLTKEKLDEINENYIDNDVLTDMTRRRVLAISGEEHTDLIGETEFTSFDYNSSKPLAQGGLLTSASGNDIVLFAANSDTSPILDVNSSVRDCLSMVDGAIHFGIWDNVMTEVKDLPERVTTDLIITHMYIGAVREQGKMVQKVQTTVS